MEVIEHMDRSWQMHSHGLDVGQAHVGGDGLDLGVGGTQSFPEGIQGIGALAVADEDHGAGVEIEYDRQVMMAFADADFVDGDASQMFELGLGKMPLEVAFLNVLDRIPADTEVSGNILDGHALRQFQGVALEGVRVAKTRVGKRELHLPRDLAVVALDARDVEEQANAFGTDRHQAKQPRLTAMGGDVGRVTNRTAQGRSILFDGEHHSAFEVVGANMAVAANTERLIE